MIIKNSNFNYQEFIIELLVYVKKFRILDIYYGTGIIKYHLWYLSSMIILIPIAYITIKNNLINKVLMNSLLINIIGVLVPVFISDDLRIMVRDVIFLGLFYFMMGIYIKKNEYQFILKLNKISNFKHISIIMILFMITIIEKYLYKTTFNGVGDYFIATIPLSILIFGLSLRIKEKNNYLILNKFGKSTLGIYLIHPLIIDITTLILVETNNIWLNRTIIWQILYTPILIIISYIIYKYIQVIKSIILNQILSKIIRKENISNIT